MKKILLVDDSREVLEAFKIAKERSEEFYKSWETIDQNVNVRFAKTYEDAKHILESNETFDWLLLDNNLNSDWVVNDGQKLIKILYNQFRNTNKINFKNIVYISSDEKARNRIDEMINKMKEV